MDISHRICDHYSDSVLLGYPVHRVYMQVDMCKVYGYLVLLY